jgi:hypothetical protein
MPRCETQLTWVIVICFTAKGREISGTVDNGEDEARAAGLLLGQPVLISCIGQGLNFYKVEFLNLIANP